MDYVNFLKQFIRSERSGGWDLHLNTHPGIYKCFKEKVYLMVKCSDQFWAGLRTDLIIKQVMMRSINPRGDITRGGGMSDSVRHVWAGSMHRLAGIHS